MKLGVVIPVGTGRESNLAQALQALCDQHIPVAQILLVLDGALVSSPIVKDIDVLRVPKHFPGMEQPRNAGVRHLRKDITHVAFLDSDIIVGPDWHEEIISAYELAISERVMVCPYEWLPRSSRNIMRELKNDPRWPQFRSTSPDQVFRGDISTGLACFSGNLVWPVDEFKRVGGFWSEIHHGRCEDGELGLRAVAMDVPISFCSTARGWHLWHPENTDLKEERNERDVPMLNARHPWVQGAGVFLVDRDGAAFDVLCSGCDESIPTIQWWEHATECEVPFELKSEE